MLPKRGNIRRKSPDRFAREIGEALRGELGASHKAIKTVMGWTGASERSAKNWLSGTHGPGGWHLILLARQSEAVIAAILRLAERDQLIPGVRLRALQVLLLQTATEIGDAFITDQRRGPRV
ncbi:hypothetical protein AA101099_0607 [Neoasaia chiangmaiensis NBRC 101099]|uniref:Uncharacterized protein n=1 Tax=Neoasaia chiangmaiensis TaxID=320497 RepID=A0A1U9KTT7_9PROT|nr:hypothetical protein [Neoasaia chiangmaiensis]AQS89149.1 hypothetical protein A0U93_00005 [Neoasaia chiangmaiensis]GBR37126.1 hypothetical protein AA101099_0607 [Neoasaia chiangmaiensis NBRC 101099]GEN16497.1 hypothetical protein NCH01_29280 [Neoasaia chiangmaiensis]